MHRKHGRIRGLINRALNWISQLVVDINSQGGDLWRGYR